MRNLIAIVLTLIAASLIIGSCQPEVDARRLDSNPTYAAICIAKYSRGLREVVGSYYPDLANEISDNNEQYASADVCAAYNGNIPDELTAYQQRLVDQIVDNLRVLDESLAP